MKAVITDEQCARCGSDCYIKDGAIWCFKCRVYLPTYVCDCCGAAFIGMAQLRNTAGSKFKEQGMEKVCLTCWKEVTCVDGG